MKWVVTQMKVNKLGFISEELMRKVEDLKAELFNLRFQWLQVN